MSGKKTMMLKCNKCGKEFGVACVSGKETVYITSRCLRSITHGDKNYLHFDMYCSEACAKEELNDR